MIKVRVKFYSPLSKLTGEKQVDIELDEGAKLVELLAKIVEIFPALQESIPDASDTCIFYNNIMPVLNNEVVDIEKVLNDNDVISLFGSISGG